MHYFKQWERAAYMAEHLALKHSSN